MDENTRRVVEMDLRMYPYFRETIKNIEAQTAYAVGMRSGLREVVVEGGEPGDLLRVAQRYSKMLSMMEEYQRQRRVVAAIDNALEKLSPLHRRVIELFYWLGEDHRRTAVALHVDERSLYRYRRHICDVVLQEFERHGVSTYDVPVDGTTKKSSGVSVVS